MHRPVGGIRVAGFVHSPLLPAAVRGTHSTKMYHVTDWYSTLVALGRGQPRAAKRVFLDQFKVLRTISRKVMTGKPSNTLKDEKAARSDL